MKKSDVQEVNRGGQIGGCYWNQKEGYVRRPLWGLSRTLKGDGNHPAGIIIEYDL